MATTSPTIVRGTGPHHVICLHGWFGRADDWGPFADFLDPDNFTWHFPEYRGYGTRINEPGDFSLMEASRDITDYIRGLAPGKLSLLGHSMGAVHMQRVLLDSPTAPSALVGISPVAASGTLLDDQTRALFESSSISESSRRAIIDFTTGGHLPRSWLDHAAADSMAHSTPEAIAGYFHAWADCDFADELGTRDLPILLLTGEHDPAVTVDGLHATYGRIYPSMQIELLPDTGHYAIVEHPLSLASTVMDFLMKA